MRSRRRLVVGALLLLLVLVVAFALRDRFRPEPAQAAWKQITSFLDAAFDGKFSKERALWRFESDSSVNYDFTKMKRWE